MAFLIGGANSAADTGYDVANSCRFNDDDSPHMHKTPGSASGTKTKFTFNCWFKRGALSTEQNLIEAGSSTNERTYVSLGVFATDELSFVHRTGGSNAIVVTSNNLLRDVSAWYMITVKYDSTDGTANNRVRLYINGTEVAYTTQTMPGSNDTTYINDDEIHYISRANHAAERFLDGYLAEVCLIDASALAPTSFGEFNSDSPNIWQPIDVSGLTFGTNGFYLDFESSGNLGNDVNGGTDLTEVNLAAADQAVDTPTNSFCTLNPLHFDTGDATNGTLSEGNCKFVSTQGGTPYPYFFSTMAASSGKWYAEFKVTTTHSAAMGAASQSHVFLGNDLYDMVYFYTGVTITGSGGSGGVGSAYGDALSDDDIVGVAMDLDNVAIYFSINGTWQGSGDPESGASKTNARALFAISSLPSGFYHFAAGDSGAGTPTIECNFGGCSAFTVSSGNADGNGYGNFEYAPPSGYLAICTKNLGSDGG